MEQALEGARNDQFSPFVGCPQQLNEKELATIDQAAARGQEGELARLTFRAAAWSGAENGEPTLLQDRGQPRRSRPAAARESDPGDTADGVRRGAR